HPASQKPFRVPPWHHKCQSVPVVLCAPARLRGPPPASPCPFSAPLRLCAPCSPTGRALRRRLPSSLVASSSLLSPGAAAPPRLAATAGRPARLNTLS